MRVSVILPSIDLVTDPENDVDVNGANLALWIQLRTYANHPAFTELELFLSPRDFANQEGISEFARRLLREENRGMGRVSVHSIYALGDVWADGVPRVLHTDDMWALFRDRTLRDQYARGPIVHVCDTHCMGHAPLHESMRATAELPMRPGDTIFPCSWATGRAITRAYGADFPYEITPIHRRIDDRDLRPAFPGEKEQIRESMGLPTDLKLAVFVGRLTPAVKGELTLLIDALAEIGDEPVGLVIAGVPNMVGYPELLRKYAEQCGVSDRVFIFGRFALSQRPKWYQLADLFLFPGDCINEAFGQTTLESMACGIPALQSNWSGMGETVTSEYGSLIPTLAAPAPERLTAMSTALGMPPQFLALAQTLVIDRQVWFDEFRRWMTDDTARIEAGNRAREVYLNQFTPAIQEVKWVALLESSLAEAIAGFSTPIAPSGRKTGIPVMVDYDAVTESYTSETWSEDRRFIWTPRGREWQAGRLSPMIYDELSGFVDLNLLAGIARIASRVGGTTGTTARTFADELAQGFVTRKDVFFHLMLLAKQGFLRIE